MAEPYYITQAELEAELGGITLDAAEAVGIIQDAEDLIDSLLGFYTPDSDTGRKIVEDDVEAWHWVKLGRATLKLAAKIYADPTILDGQQWNSVSGPDFSFSGRLSSQIPNQVIVLLNDTGLRRMTGRAVAGEAPAGSNGELIDGFFSKGQPNWSYRSS